MSARDAYRFINELDEPTVQSFINRLEFRGKDPAFTQWRDDYLARLRLGPAATVLDLGCGTGVATRALAGRADFDGRVVGVDQSPTLLEAAMRLAARDDVAERTEFQVGDVERLDLPDATFDAVIAHTTISHVADPLAMLREAARVARPGALVAIFDGDYASWTFDHPDERLAATMDRAIIAAVVNNPRVLRAMPRLLEEAGLEREQTLAYVYADIGNGAFYASAIEAYTPLAVRAGLASEEQAHAWLDYQRRAMATGSFFGACNYYTYLARQPGTPRLRIRRCWSSLRPTPAGGGYWSSGRPSPRAASMES